MSLVIDTTIVIACVLEEPRREVLMKLTANEELTAPASLQWEVGNALSAMFKHGRITLDIATIAFSLYQRMPIQLRVIDVPSSIKIAHRYKIYAYDAYMLQCAVECGFRLLTLDRGLTTAARAARVPLCEVPP